MNKKIRFYFWMIQGYIRKHTLKTALILSFIIATFYGISLLIPIVNKPNEDVFIEGAVGTFTKRQVLPQISDYISYGLVTTDNQGNPIPKAAESIESDSTGKKFTVRLRKDLKWHNGAPVLSTDLAYNLDDVQVDKPDEYTLVFNLKDSFAPFPTLLTSPLIKISSANDEILGIGDYYLSSEEYRQTQYITALELKSTKKSPSTVKIKFYPTEQDAITALKLGQIHGLRISENDEIKTWNNAVIYKKVIPKRFVGVFFQLKDPLIGGKDATLRQALGMALTDIPGQLPFAGPFPTNSWATTSTENKYRNDPIKAKQIIDQYKKDNKSSSQALELRLSTLPAYKETALYIAESWTAAGVNTSIEIVDKIPEQFQALVVGQEIPADPDQYSLWHSTQKQSNITNYDFNKRVDKDLEDARKTIDQTVRKEKYADFEKQILEDVPVLYLYQPFYEYVLLKKYNTENVKKLKQFSSQ
ncbi:MAG: ABC transporter substrate-binding protein [bacterium]|nr:ABC transporter substrate-binding protein [bacterium]